VTLWISKIVAAILTLLGIGAILSLPVLLVNHFHWQASWFTTQPPQPIEVATGLLLLLLIGHSISTSVRSRSRWIALDFAGLLVVGSLVWLAFKRMFFTGALSALENMTVWSIAGLIVVLLIAGGVQLARGRAEKVQSHRALSLSAWSMLFAGALILNLFSLWFVNVTPASLQRVKAFATQPGTDWIWLSGEARHRGHEFHPLFGYQPSTGKALTCPGVCNEMLFSADGKTAVALAPEFRYSNPGRIIYVADLRAAKPELRPTNLTMNFYGATAVSPDGSRLALVGSTAAIYSLRNEKLLASIPLNGSEQGEASFVDNDHLLLWATHRGEPSTGHLWLYDIATKTSRDLVTVSSAQSDRFMMHARGDRRLGRVLVSTRRSASGDRPVITTTIQEFDLSSGQETFQRQIVGMNYVIPMHLTNGEIAFVTYAQSENPTLVMVDRKGAERAMSLAPLKHAFLTGQREDGLLVLHSNDGDASKSALSLFDPRTGRFVARGRELAPLNTFTTFYASDLLDRTQRAQRGNYFIDRSGALVRSDLVSGKTERLLGGS
jgi:hypothetical protein